MLPAHVQSALIRELRPEERSVDNAQEVVRRLQPSASVQASAFTVNSKSQMISSIKLQRNPLDPPRGVIQTRAQAPRRGPPPKADVTPKATVEPGKKVTVCKQCGLTDGHIARECTHPELWEAYAAKKAKEAMEAQRKQTGKKSAFGDSGAGAVNRNSHATPTNYKRVHFQQGSS